MLTKLRKVITQLYRRLFPQKRKNIPATFGYNGLSEVLSITRDTKAYLYFSLAVYFSIFSKSVKNEDKDMNKVYHMLLIQITRLITVNKLYLTFLVEEKAYIELNACLNNPLSGGPLYEEPTLLIHLDEVDFLQRVEDELISGLDSPTITGASKIISTIRYLLDQISESKPELIRIKAFLDKIGQGYGDLTDIELKFVMSLHHTVEKDDKEYLRNVNRLKTYLTNLENLNKCLHMNKK